MYVCNCETLGNFVEEDYDELSDGLLYKIVIQDIIMCMSSCVWCIYGYMG